MIDVKWSAVVKCSLCHLEFNEGDKVEYFIDENGYMRISHEQCYSDKYR